VLEPASPQGRVPCFGADGADLGIGGTGGRLMDRRLASVETREIMAQSSVIVCWCWALKRSECFAIDAMMEPEASALDDTLIRRLSNVR
jgi:hypothetical protein